MTMKIEQHENNASGDTYTFQHNPQSYSDKSEKNVDRKKSATYWDYFTLGDAQLKTKRNISIKGHFDGSTKETNYRNLYKEMHDNKIKRLFFSSDKFMIVIPMGLERTQSGGRTNFIDYVGNFVSPFNVLFSDPVNSTDATNAGTNEGDMPSPILQLNIDNVTSGTDYQVTDSEGNGFKFNATETGDVTVYLIKMLDIGGGFYQTWYYEALYNSGNRCFLQWASASKPLYLRLQPDEAISTLDPREDPDGSNTDISSDLTIKWASAYSSD